MNTSMHIVARGSQFQRAVAVLSALMALALGGASLPAQSSANRSSTPMKQFTIIFRQGPRQLTEADLKTRAEQTRAWAQTHNAAGHKLDPHILTPESRWIGPDGDGPVPTSSAGPITAILFLEARDLAEAVEVAKAHPALRYGASVEVRPWAPPPSVQP
jgi:hypothetical protein